MALKKMITLKNGTTVDYHRVKNIYVENDENIYVEDFHEEDFHESQKDMITISTLLQSFVSENYRDESLTNVVSQTTYTFNVERPIVEDNNIFEVIYGLLKTLDVFTDAEDV